MQGNGGEFKSEWDDNRSKRSVEAVIPGRCDSIEPGISQIPGLVLAHHPRNDDVEDFAIIGTALVITERLPHFRNAPATACQIRSLISVAAGLAITVAATVRLAQASTSRRIQTSPSV